MDLARDTIPTRKALDPNDFYFTVKLGVSDFGELHARQCQDAIEIITGQK
jgi:hypothetical protein